MRRIGPLVLGALLLAGCGSTVPLSQQAALSGSGGGSSSLSASGSGSGAASPAGSAAGSAPGGAGAAGAGGSVAAGSSASTGAGAAAGSGSLSGASAGAASGPGSPGSSDAGSSPGTAAASATVPATGRGWDSKYVYIGVTTQNDAETAYAAAGFAGIDPGNTAAQATADADYINAHGGILGRQVKLVFKDVPTLASAENPAQYSEGVCTDFVQDSPVVAVINMVTTMDSPNFWSCLAKAGIPLFSLADTAVDDAVQQPLMPYFYTVVAPAWDQLATVLVAQLKAQGWFGGWNAQTGTPAPGAKTKIGILVLDDDTGNAIGKILTRALDAAGYTNVVTYAYEAPGDQITSAVLNFEQNGVTNVISDDIELSTFQTSAAEQHYVPRYGINTYNDPATNLAKVAPASQQVGDEGVGWAPTYDVAAAQDPGSTPGETQCLSTMSAANVTNSDRLAVAFGLAMCDGMQLVSKGASAGNGFTAAAINRGIDQVAPTYSPAFTFATGLVPGRAFVPGAVRDLVWNGGCSCFNYTSGTNHPF